MEAQELRERIAAFPRWHYQFEFDGDIRTPMPDRGMVNRHKQRQRYFFEPLLALTGGSLRGRRVLDLGCNAGFWSLKAIEAGADFVLGVDAAPTSLAQAELVFEVKQVDRARYRFELGNVFAHELSESFDVVLCLGLMEHVAKPVELFELMAGAGAELIVIDTEISRARSSLFEVSSLYDPQSTVDHDLVLVPSRQAIFELAGEFGFTAVPLAQNITDYSGMKDYRRQRRLAFICSRQTPLDQLERERRPPIIPWWLRALNPFARPRGRAGAAASRR
jgi:SAM-dependent methyltransferase